MFSSKILFAALVLLLAISTEGTEVGVRNLGKKKKKNKNKKEKRIYRVKGTAVPDASGFCYPGLFYDKKGKKKLGSFLDCVLGAPVDLPNGDRVFSVLTTFEPDDPNELTLKTTCEITVSEDQDLLPKYNARENCKNKEDGLVEPAGAKGGVSMKGKVNNTLFPKLTFDLKWTITYKLPKDPEPEPEPEEDDTPAGPPAGVDDD